MSVGFRPTPEDTEIIRAHQRPEESTSDVLRRALRALDRERWDQEARADMERIAAAGEDLSDEPDEWGYDDADSVVDLRGSEDRPGVDLVADSQFGLVLVQAKSGEAKSELPESLGRDFLDAVGFSSRFLKLKKVNQILGNYSENAVPAFIAHTGLRDSGVLASWNFHSPSDVAASVQASGNIPPDRRPSSWKLTHLHAAARRRRAGKR